MSIERIQRQLSYFKECYQADTRTLSITNIFQSKIENRYFFEGQEHLLTEDLNELPLPDDYAREVLKNLSIYQREKILYYCALFVVGKNPDSLAKSGKICAPVILYPAEILMSDETHYLKIDQQKRIININFLSTLRKNDEDDLYELISNCIDTSFEDIGPVGELSRVFETKLDDMDASELLLFPALHKESKIKRMLQPKVLEGVSGFKAVPGACLCMIKRSVNTRGIVSELQTLSKAIRFSPALEYLMDDSIDALTLKLKSGKVPSLLSPAQQEAVEAVNRYKGTLLIGPPGTGKSYTIASLAVSFLAQGRKVLIACKTDEAVDVVHRKMEKDLDIQQVAMRAGRSDYKKQLKATLSNLLTNTRKRPEDQSRGLSKLKDSLEELEKRLADTKDDFEEQVTKDLRWGQFLATYGGNGSFLDKLKFRYIRWRVGRKHPHWHITSRYLDSSMKYLDLLRAHIITRFSYQVHQALYSSRVMFRDFLKSLSARNSQRQASLFEGIDVTKLLETFPIWLSNMSDIHEVLPMSPGLFDLVIIDEASQCDIASALPILQRGKRFVVVGDPKQLRHVSFISRSLQYGLARKYQLEDQYVDYRTTSILDWVMERITQQDQVVFLNEHYRSKPKIISYSNQQFYNEALAVMTTLETIHADDSLELIHVDGKRDPKGHNAEEAELIIQKIKSIIKEEQNLTVELAQTMGVLSPFKDQVEYIARMISQEIDITDIQKHEIACGTAYSFQGEERDIMLLSFAVDEGSHHAAFHHLNKEDVFNVSITRARSLQLVYVSFSESFDPGPNLKRYLSHIKNKQIPEARDEGRDLFVDQVRSGLAGGEMECWVNYSVGGLTIDLLVKSKQGKLFGINLIGYPGEFEDALRMEDYKILRRAGLPTFPLPYSYWLFDQERCYEEIVRFSS